MGLDDQIKNDPQVRILVDWLRSIERDINRLHLRKATISAELDVRVGQMRADHYAQTQKEGEHEHSQG